MLVHTCTLCWLAHPGAQYRTVVMNLLAVMLCTFALLARLTLRSFLEVESFHFLVTLVIV